MHHLQHSASNILAVVLVEQNYIPCGVQQNWRCMHALMHTKPCCLATVRGWFGHHKTPTVGCQHRQLKAQQQVHAIIGLIAMTLRIVWLQLLTV